MLPPVLGCASESHPITAVPGYDFPVSSFSGLGLPTSTISPYHATPGDRDSIHDSITSIQVWDSNDERLLVNILVRVNPVHYWFPLV